jgi:hypothetical protein
MILLALSLFPREVVSNFGPWDGFRAPNLQATICTLSTYE